MTIFNTEKMYSNVSKLLHRVTAIIVLGLLCLGVAFSYIPKDIEKMLMPYHKSAGVTLLILMLVRLVWTLINPSPRLPTRMAFIEKAAAKLVHFLLYFVVIMMCISGVIMTLAGGHLLPFWGFGDIHLAFIPLDKALSHLVRPWHTYLAWTIFGLLIIHTLAALKHHFYDHDDVLKRMV
ncbi:MAG: cytochrome b [Coxiellaceae bacterium]|nr:cytochrome b [Coxiellaceae bacterium]